MCRFILYSGPPVTLSSLLIEPTNSLIHQSFHSYESDDPLNADGFGIAWYMPELSDRPAVFRSSHPAWSNRNLLSLSPLTQTRCVLAHVRAATGGLGVSEDNCHPFAHGPYAFMHNGDVGNFAAIRRRLLDELSDEAFATIRGNTDSEHVFAMLLDELKNGDGAPGAGRLADALRRTIARVVALSESEGGGEASYLNIGVSDGRTAAASRFVSGGREDAASLYVHTGRRYTCSGGVCRMIDAADGQGAVIISSEPVSGDPGWETVPVNHVVSVSPDGAVKTSAV